MDRAEIIEAVVQKASESSAEATEWTGPGRSYEDYLLATLKRKLSQVDDDEILTCADLGQFGVACCPVYHDDYPDEQGIVQLESGCHAWVCCAIERALRGLEGTDQS